MNEEPASLQTLCLKRFGSFVSQVCVKCMMIHPQQWDFGWLQVMICNMPHVLANELTITLLKSIDTLPFDSYYYNEHTEHFDFLYKMIHAILHPEVTELILSKDELQTFPHVITWNFIIPFLCKSMFTLQKLRIVRLPRCRVHVEVDFSEQNWTLENLVEFTYAEQCTNKFLENIISSNVHLKRLDVVSSRNVTDESVDRILKLQNLEHLNIWETGISGCGVLQLTRSSLRKQLKYFGFSSGIHGVFACVTSELEYITALEIGCRELDVDAILSLKSLKGLSNLKALTVHLVERGFETGLEQLIKILGSQLLYLHLYSASPNLVNVVRRHCNKLKCLCIDSFFSAHLEQLDLETQPGFECITSVYLRTATAEGTVKNILSCCINVKQIGIQTCFNSDCLLMDEILNKNPLIYLEELTWWPTGTLATARIIQEVIKRCPTLEIFRGSYVWHRKGDVQKLLDEVQEFYPEARILQYIKTED